MGKDAVVRLTQQLVAMSSENPGSSEREIAAFVADWFGDMASVSAQVHEVRPGRPNVVARLRGNGSAPPVVMLAHMDTVPRGEGWRHDPFAGTIEDGKLYGRGACDMKGGLAVVMRVIRNLAIAGGERRRDVLLCATMDEEGLGMLGINDLIDRGVVDKHSLVICTEPTDLELVIAHKGVVWYEVKTEGKSCHAGNPELGIDAISAMGEIVCALKRKVGSLPHEHPLVGRSSIAFGRVEGGFKTNVVSDHCRLEVDIRIVPPMTIPELTAMVEETARGAAAVVPGARVSVQHINTDRPPVEADVNSELVGAIVDSFRRVTGREVVKSGFRAYTDASVVSARTGNTTSVLFGPGRLAEAHTIDEYVPVDHLLTAEAVLTQAVDRLCRRDVSLG